MAGDNGNTLPSVIEGLSLPALVPDPSGYYETEQIVNAKQIIGQLYDIMRQRGRNSNLAASVRAGEMLLRLMGVDSSRVGGLVTDAMTAMMIVNNTQINTTAGDGERHVDRLTEELIAVVRAGNNGHGGRKE